MNRQRQAIETETMTIRPAYVRAVNSIIKPEQQISCTRYFWQEWLPRLGAIRWLLVLALRTICTSRQADGNNRGEVTRSELASILGVHEVTISRILTTERSETEVGWRVLKATEKDDSQTVLLSRFIPRLRYRYERDPDTGSTRRVGYIIDVAMDDPLVPEDEDKLAVAIAEQILAINQDARTAAAEKSPSPTRRRSATKKRNATSSEVVKCQNAISTASPSGQNATSRTPSRKRNALTLGVKYLNESALTLTNNFNYRELTLPLTLSNKTDIRKAIAPLVEYCKNELNDHHSTGLYYATLTQLYPHGLEVFTKALDESMAATLSEPRLNKGAVFVNTLKQRCSEAGMALTFGASKASDVGPKTATEDEEVYANNSIYPLASSVDGNGFALPGLAMSSNQLWLAAIDSISLSCAKKEHLRWLKTCRIEEFSEGRMIVVAPNGFVRDWASSNAVKPLEKYATSIVDSEVKVEFVLVSQVGGRQILPDRVR